MRESIHYTRVFFLQPLLLLGDFLLFFTGRHENTEAFAMITEVKDAQMIHSINKPSVTFLVLTCPVLTSNASIY